MNLEIANVCLGIMANAVRFYAIKRLVTLFLDNNQCRWKHIWVLYIIACCYTSFIYEVFKSPVWNVFANLTALLLIVFPYKVKIIKKLLIICTIYIVNIAVEGVVVFTFTKYIIGESFNQIYECVTSLVILLISIILEKTVFSERETELPTFYIIILGMVPVISIACICCLAIIDIEQNQTRVLISSFSIWILFVNIVIFYLYNALTRFYSDRIEKKMFEQMVEAYSLQLEMMQESRDRVNSLRHDMKHHIIELSSMIKEEENPEAIKYLKSMEQFMLNPRELVSTGNNEIDGILNYLLQNVEDILDNVNINISVQEKTCWKDFSICVIIGNLVDNAIREASNSQEKYLDINIQSKKGIILISIENSYSGDIVQQDYKFKTSQKAPEVHGFGLESVKKVVEMNGGEISIDYGQGRFKVRVLLYLSNIK